MGNKIVKVYVLKGLNGTSLVIENYRVSNEKIYGMLTPIHMFEVATDDILQAIGEEHKVGKWLRKPIRNDKGGCIGAEMICSCCNKDNRHDEYMNYCPNCGAEMRGSENE